MVQRDSLWKRAASQPTQPPQSTKRNAVVPVHVGLCTVLARCLPLPLSSSEEEEQEEEGGEEAQELDIDLDQDEDNKNNGNDAGLVDPDIQQPTQEPPDEEVGFRRASGRVVWPS